MTKYLLTSSKVRRMEQLFTIYKTRQTLQEYLRKLAQLSMCIVIGVVMIMVIMMVVVVVVVDKRKVTIGLFALHFAEVLLPLRSSSIYSVAKTYCVFDRIVRVIDQKNLRNKHNLWFALRESRVVEQHRHYICPLVVVTTAEHHIVIEGQALVYH